MESIYNSNMKDRRDRIRVIQAFGKHLKKVRKEKGMTQNNLENKSGLSLRMISDMEGGITQPTLTTLFKLAKGLNMALVELMEPFSMDIDH